MGILQVIDSRRKEDVGRAREGFLRRPGPPPR
jgi:hypothetical protein